jgi:hypothetical protein
LISGNIAWRRSAPAPRLPAPAPRPPRRPPPPRPSSRCAAACRTTPRSPASGACRRAAHRLRPLRRGLSYHFFLLILSYDLIAVDTVISPPKPHSTARHVPYLLVRVRVRPERHRAQSCAIALRSPALLSGPRGDLHQIFTPTPRAHNTHGEGNLQGGSRGGLRLVFCLAQGRQDMCPEVGNTVSGI